MTALTSALDPTWLRQARDENAELRLPAAAGPVIADALEAQAEVDALKHDIERATATNSELLAEVERLRAAQWQPIETAPTDGIDTLVLYWTETDTYGLGYCDGDLVDDWHLWDAYQQGTAPCDYAPSHWLKLPGSDHLVRHVAHGERAA